MANSTYAIPLKKLCDEKDDLNMSYFTEELDIDLENPGDCRYPTVRDLKSAIEAAGLRISVEQWQNFRGEFGWCCGIEEPNGYETPICADGAIDEYEAITEMLSFPRGNWETILKFLLALQKEIGPILFYCDSGEMAMVTDGKSVEEILAEL